MKALGGLGNLLLLVMAGCVPMQPGDSLPAIPSEELRSAMAAGLSLKVDEPDIVMRFQVPPRGPCSGSVRGATLGAALAASGGGGHPLAVVATLAMMPLFALVGGLYGLFAALPAEVVDDSLAALETAAREAQPGRNVALRAAGRSKERGGPSLGSPGAGIVVSIAAPEIALTGPWTFDPELQFTASVEVRLFHAEGGKALFIGHFRYVGEAHPLRAWAADGAASFREQLRMALDVLGRDLAEYLFFIVPMAPRRVSAATEVPP